MSLPKAYCVDCDDVIDIVQAHQFYFSRPAPRKELGFLCPSATCRKLELPPPVLGINYMKIPGADKFVQRPHYRIPSGHEHSEDCPWVELSEAIDALDRDPKTRKFTNLKKSELVDVFDPSIPERDAGNRVDSAAVSAIRLLGTRAARIDAYRAYLKDNPNRTSRLHEAAHCFEALTPEELENTKFRIGSLPVKTYRKYFTAARFCTPTAAYPRIYYGRANVRKWDTGYSVRFAVRAKQSDGEECTVSVFIANELLDAFRGKAALLATLEAAAELTGNTLTCYAFGRIERSQRDGTHRIDIRIANLHSLALTLNLDA